MAEVSIDIMGDDDEFVVENPHGFDKRLTGCGLVIDMTHEQAESVFRALRPFFEDEQPAVQGGWRPIETAPTDGRQLILLLTPSRFPQVAFSNSWWTSGFSIECKPTHWMPIPDLPTVGDVVDD